MLSIHSLTAIVFSMGAAIVHNGRVRCGSARCVDAAPVLQLQALGRCLFRQGPESTAHEYALRRSFFFNFCCIFGRIDLLYVLRCSFSFVLAVRGLRGLVLAHHNNFGLRFPR